LLGGDTAAQRAAQPVFHADRVVGQ
jgi:hypothetical protein